MVQNEIKEIDRLRQSGYGYKRIAGMIGIPQNTVKSYCRRHPITRVMPDGVSVCRQCGKTLEQMPHRKARVFCSDACRMSWWKAHPEEVTQRAVYSFICENCGLHFTAYGNQHRKFCSHSCYIAKRFKGGAAI